MPRFRTIQQCLEEIKRIDENTIITGWLIRNLCKENKVHCILSGNKTLVNLDSLFNYFNGVEGNKVTCM